MVVDVILGVFWGQASVLIPKVVIDHSLVALILTGNIEVCSLRFVSSCHDSQFCGSFRLEVCKSS